MKRTIAFVAGVAMLGIGVYLGGRAAAQQPATAAQGGQPTVAPLQTRIATLNMVQVLKNYSKFKQAEEQLKGQIQGYEKELEPRRQAFNAKRSALAAATDPAQKEALEHELRKFQLELTELEEGYRKELAKRQGELAVQIFKEVEDVVQGVARTYNIEMVLFYNDAPKDSTNPANSADFYSPVNVQRKLMSLGAIMPLYIDPRIDITGPITDMLNKRVGS